MQKDLKIGLVVGLVLTALAAVWLSTRPSLSIKARMQQQPRSRDVESPQETAVDEQPRFTTDLPDTAPAETEQSNIPAFTEPPVSEQEKIETRKFHVVRKGETLSDISYRYYGSAGKWQKILDANRKVIEDPRKLRPGTRLIIPD